MKKIIFILVAATFVLASCAKTEPTEAPQTTQSYK